MSRVYSPPLEKLQVITRALVCLLGLLWPIAPAAQGSGTAAVESSIRPQPRAATETADAATPPADDTAQSSTATEADADAPLSADLRPVARDPRTTRPLALAFDAMAAEDWDAAFDRAAGDGPVALDVVRWSALRAGRGTLPELMDFLDRNGDWPGLPYLKEQSEGLLTTASTEQVLTFFRDHVPRTGTGALVLARALHRTGQRPVSDAVITRAWRTLALEPFEEAVFLENHGDLLADQHWARLDHTLWEGWTTNPLRLEPLVSEAEWSLAQARMALRRGQTPPEVPAALAKDPGLAYEKFRQAKGDKKRQLLLGRSSSAAALGRPEAWAPDRRPMARQLMRNGDLETAYAIASQHHLTEGRDYADLEWLSGYLSLRLGEPARALTHFQRFRADVFTPISLARAGYWLGRAHEALDQPDEARAAYAFGAQYQTAFYGLLAAEKAGLPLSPVLGGVAPSGDWRSASFTRSSVHAAAVLLLASGQDWPAERFWTHLAESQSPEQIALMGQMLEEMGEPHIQVMLGKRAAQAGLEIVAPYYALHPVAEQNWPVPTELVLAIARRESEFDPQVTSHAGARGLMQLMPATARDVSGDLGLGYDAARLFEPGYNAQLGAEYLRQMAERYGGNPVLVSVAYNAGPGRADRWQSLYGDPRARGADIVDWIEGIPFRETRNYVMRVTESLPIYRARLGQPPLPEPFSQMLKGSSLSR